MSVSDTDLPRAYCLPENLFAWDDSCVLQIDVRVSVRNSYGVKVYDATKLDCVMPCPDRAYAEEIFSFVTAGGLE